MQMPSTPDLRPVIAGAPDSSHGNLTPVRLLIFKKHRHRIRCPLLPGLQTPDGCTPL